MTTGIHYEMIAKERFGRPDARWTSLERLHADEDGIDATRITISDVPKYVRGEKAGKWNFRASTNHQTTIITDEQANEWLAAHPEICPECANEREVFVSWNHIDGTTMKPCPTCCGRAVEAPQAQEAGRE